MEYISGKRINYNSNKEHTSNKIFLLKNPRGVNMRFILISGNRKVYKGKKWVHNNKQRQKCIRLKAKGYDGVLFPR